MSLAAVRPAARWLPFPGELALFLAAHVAVWTLFASLVQGGLHHDLTEAWAWAREPAWGYDKHPPLSAWMVYAWFQVFPRETWAFFLLAETNAALALAGAYAFAGRFLDRSGQWTAMLLLCLTPFYNLMAWKFNANTAQLALWPWTAYFLVRSLQSRALLPSLLLGLLGGLALLAKYYAGLLLVSCALAAVLHPRAKAYFMNPAPYVALAMVALTLAPHAAWILDHHAATLEYARNTTTNPRGETLQMGAVALLRACFMLAPAGAILWWILRASPAVCRLRLTRETCWLAELALGPLVLTLLACVVANVRITVEFMIPIFSLLPTLALVLCKGHDGRAGQGLADGPLLWQSGSAGGTSEMGSRGLVSWPARDLRRIVYGVMGVMLLAAPAVAYGAFTARGQTWTEPREAVAREATRAWHAAFGPTPIPAVAGEETYANAISFYSPDAPKPRPDFDNTRLDDPTAFAGPGGMVIVCRSADVICLDNARRLEAPGIRRVDGDFNVTLWGFGNPPRHITMTFIPPRHLGAEPLPHGAL